MACRPRRISTFRPRMPRRATRCMPTRHRRVEAELHARGFASIAVHSEAPDRRSYLLRPDLGRRLLRTRRPSLVLPGALLFVICDGLSAIAVQRHAVPLLRQRCRTSAGPIAPIIVAEQGRVALGDDIGEAMGAEAVAVLIGERPGLAAADSLGVVSNLAAAARPHRRGAQLHLQCTIRGLAPDAAADKLLWLIDAMRRLRLTGVLPEGRAAHNEDGSGRIDMPIGFTCGAFWVSWPGQSRS